MEYKKILEERIKHASVIAQYGNLDAALEAGVLTNTIDATLSELLVLGLLRQGVKTYFTVLGHGSTE
jgi:3D-(3,5/4)-trihydroxycyclohexane-1,2-dione acylhydrolase (decyclizing)